jgi:DNA-binding NarL/FixJ family response regulator
VCEGVTIHISPRQQEIIAMLAEGVPVKCIGARLDPAITEHTVRMQVRLIADKLPGHEKPLLRILRWHFSKAA